MQSVLFVQLLISGLLIGSLYALLGLGFVLIYKATRVLNFAQGELLMLAAYGVFLLVNRSGWPFFWALPLVIAAMFVLGIAVERVFLRRMVGEPIFAVVMMTIGLAAIFRGVVGLVWGHDTHRLAMPFADGYFRLNGAVVSELTLVTIAAAGLLLIGFALFFQRSRWGVAMRATASDQDTALLMGVPVPRVFGLSWGLAAAVAAVAGVALAGNQVLDPHMSHFGLRVFPAVVLGGLDSIPGAVLGGLLLGVTEALVSGFLDPLFRGSVRDLVAYSVLVLILMVRPYGLFGTEEIERV